MPHKSTVIPMLDFIDPTAKAMGAVNTLVFGQDGSVSGFNTDGFGFVQSILDVQPQWRADAGPIVVLGAGGAARAIVYALAQQGAKDIRIANRTFERALAIEQAFGGPVKAIAWAQRHAALEDCALLVNSTNQGMYAQPALDLDLQYLPARTLVCDAIYVPLETPLLATARLRGHTTVNGLGMLLNQARPAFKAWFGVMPSISPALLQAVHATF